MKLASLLGLQYRTTWQLTHRIRAMMADAPDLLRGLVELDETSVGASFHGASRIDVGMLLHSAKAAQKLRLRPAITTVDIAAGGILLPGVRRRHFVRDNAETLFEIASRLGDKFLTKGAILAMLTRQHGEKFPRLQERPPRRP